MWLTHLERDEPNRADFKLPAQRALELAGVALDVPEVLAPLHAPIPSGETWREVFYEERAGVGYLHFDFHNGAMSASQSRRLREALVYARARPTRVIVLMGGRTSWSNGIHLNLIEAADDPAEASWGNLHAINAVVREVVETGSHLVLSAVAGGAGAGGVPLALAADHVVVREGVTLCPYYRHMGACTARSTGRT